MIGQAMGDRTGLSPTTVPCETGSVCDVRTVTCVPTFWARSALFPGFNFVFPNS